MGRRGFQVQRAESVIGLEVFERVTGEKRLRPNWGKMCGVTDTEFTRNN